MESPQRLRRSFEVVSERRQREQRSSELGPELKVIVAAHAPRLTRGSGRGRARRRGGLRGGGGGYTARTAQCRARPGAESKRRRSCAATNARERQLVVAEPQE